MEESPAKRLKGEENGAAPAVELPVLQVGSMLAAKRGAAACSILALPNGLMRCVCAGGLRRRHYTRGNADDGHHGHPLRL